MVNVSSNSSFICQQCGQTHEGLPTHRGALLPDAVLAIPSNMRENRARWTSDLCQFGKRYFIRCLLKVPFIDQSGHFGWGLWVEVDEPLFRRYVDLYEKDGSREPAYEGRIANEIPGTDSILNMVVSIQFRSRSERPVITYPKENRCWLAQEQRQGIDAKRHHELLDLSKGKTSPRTSVKKIRKRKRGKLNYQRKRPAP